MYLTDLAAKATLFQEWNEGVRRAREDYYLRTEPKQCRKGLHLLTDANKGANGGCRKCSNKWRGNIRRGTK